MNVFQFGKGRFKPVDLKGSGRIPDRLSEPGKCPGLKGVADPAQPFTQWPGLIDAKRPGYRRDFPACFRLQNGEQPWTIAKALVRVGGIRRIRLAPGRRARPDGG